VRQVDAAKEDDMCSYPWARRPGKTAATMERNRLYNRDHPHRESPQARKKSNRKYRISSYGLTQESFDLLLEAQRNACGMCHEPFGVGQLIHVDHDHACCRGRIDRAESASADCLCHTCSIALGHIEHRYAMARTYLDNPPVRLLHAA
jgi:hypothetical protein